MKRYAWIGFACLLLALSFSQAGNRNVYPLPEERGTAGTLAALEKLPVYFRVLQITAHPDDESAATLTWLSRKYRAQTALFCMTRGEGGQNILGSETYEALGLVRTGELREACKIYGTELYFGHVLDFGFSKTAEETLSKWGHEESLADLVRFIRRWRPNIILSRFQGSAADGHGHHQATGILAREAFRAAGDPAKFPEQLTEGVQLWQPAKLYISSFGGGFAEGDPADWTVRVPVGDYDPILGRSYREIASEGYSKHRTQGNGAVFSLPGRAYEYFKLIDSTVGIKEKEESFFDSLDFGTNLAGTDRNSLPTIEQFLDGLFPMELQVAKKFDLSNPERSAHDLATGIKAISALIPSIESSALKSQTKERLLDALKMKLADFQKAMSAVLGIYLSVTCKSYTGIPGESIPVSVHFYNRGTAEISLKGIQFQAPGAVAPSTGNSHFGKIPGEEDETFHYSIELSDHAAATEPFWYLENSGDSRYKIRKTEDEFAPFGKPAIIAEAIYDYEGVEVPIQVPVRAQAGDPIRGADFVQFQIVPEISVSLEPDFAIVPSQTASARSLFRVVVSNNRTDKVEGTLKLISEAGWTVQPPESTFVLSRKGEVFTGSFVVQIPAGAKAGDHPVEAVATTDGREFRRGYRVISYPENWTRNLYSPAQSKIEKFDIRIAQNLTVGYVPGAGDEVPSAIERIGVKVQTLSASDLAFGDLSRFSAIITGIRAYNVNEDLKANNQRLLDYVARGGTLIVQYVRPIGMPGRDAGSSFIYAPYPMSVSNSDRITVEDSPIKILDPANPVFSRPNKISESDFQGWVQERGLYFMNTWDSHYTPLLSGNDPGETPKNGGTLYAVYGKGHYIYTGYSWFRQLPAGVPGAFRIFVNMLSLGQ